MVMDCLIFSQHRSSQVWKRVPFNNGEERRGTWGQMLSLSLSLSLAQPCVQLRPPSKTMAQSPHIPRYKLVSRMRP
jgi:hypothetical protein